MNKYCNKCGCYIPIEEEQCIACGYIKYDFNYGIDRQKEIVYNNKEIAHNNYVTTNKRHHIVADTRYCASCLYRYESKKHPDYIYCMNHNEYNLAAMLVEDSKEVKCTRYCMKDQELKKYIEYIERMKDSIERRKRDNKSD